jgi:Fe2+ transport system protein FeoA
LRLDLSFQSNMRTSSLSLATLPEGTVPLTTLRAGARAQFQAADLDPADYALVRALGLTDCCRLRVCKAGEPCIVQVRTTRIGLSGVVASGIYVVPEPTQ